MATKKKLLQAAAGNAGGEALNVEDVFSTYLYDGNSTARSISNGIDLSGEGGLVWTKLRGPNTSTRHVLIDTVRGVEKYLESNTNDAEETQSGNSLTAFNSNGYSVGNWGSMNASGQTYASWTFRKAEKFFDVVTYTGTGSVQNIAHNLNSVPSCMFVKCTSNGGIGNSWIVYHAGIGNGHYLYLNADSNKQTGASTWNNTTPTSTHFTVGTKNTVNTSGRTYVAYLFAHNDGDGEFGPDGDADIIKCGSFTTDGTGDVAEINLGFEPQWIMLKKTSGTGDWRIGDVMRGDTVDNTFKVLEANTSDAEGTLVISRPTATGYKIDTGFGTNATGIYIAIRRGPLAPAETATELFDIDVSTAYQPYSVTTSLNYVDATINRVLTSGQAFLHNRLTGSKWMFTDSTNAESNSPNDVRYDFNGKVMPYFYTSGDSHVNYMWKRAPNFFDVVAYSGTGTSNQTLKHNLGVVPEMMWVKRRNGGSSWLVYHKGLNVNGDGRPETDTIDFTNSAAFDYLNAWFDTAPTDTEFTVGTYNNVTNNGNTFISYLFATLAGISKVGSVTHSGTTNVDCGFSSGARFILLKRTDASGDWYVWDSERGIVSGNDPYLLLNSTAAEVTNTDYIDPLSSGFTITSSFTAGDYIFYAIA